MPTSSSWNAAKASKTARSPVAPSAMRWSIGAPSADGKILRPPANVDVTSSIAKIAEPEEQAAAPKFAEHKPQEAKAEQRKHRPDEVDVDSGTGEAPVGVPAESETAQA